MLRDGVIVGRHIGHDIQALNCACDGHFNLTLKNRSLGTMDLTPHDRHTAGGDAFLTARIFLRLLRAAKAVGRARLASLCQPYQRA